MLKLLATGRWLSFTAVALLAILAFGALSWWQWNRAEEKRQDHQIVARNTAVDARSLGQVLNDPGEWKHVTVSGEYGASQRLLRNRPLEGSQGFWVVSPLISDGTHVAEGTVVWIARGWIPQRTAATRSVAAPPPPDGSVTATGYLRASAKEPARPSASFPDGQIAALNANDLTEAEGLATDARLADWYVQDHLEQERGSDIKTLPVPEADDARNLSYAGQWLLFASIAIGGWFYFLRREAKDGIEPGAEQGTPELPTSPDSSEAAHQRA